MQRGRFCIMLAAVTLLLATAGEWARSYRAFDHVGVWWGRHQFIVAVNEGAVEAWWVRGLPRQATGPEASAWSVPVDPAPAAPGGSLFVDPDRYPEISSSLVCARNEAHGLIETGFGGLPPPDLQTVAGGAEARVGNFAVLPTSEAIPYAAAKAPLWMLCAMAAWAAGRGILWWKRGRQQPGFCTTCNYDLRGSPARCPECGTRGPADLMVAASTREILTRRCIMTSRWLRRSQYWLLVTANLLLVVGYVLWTRPAPPAARATPPPLPVDSSLLYPVHVHFQNVPLQVALERLAAEAKVSVVAHWTDMEGIGVRPTTEVSATVTGTLPLGQAMELVLRLSTSQTPAFGIERQGQVVEVGSRDLAAQMGPVTRVYDVADLVEYSPDPLAPWGPDPQKSRELIDLVQRVITPGQWRGSGGSIWDIQRVDMKLVVTQGRTAHNEIARLLNGLRAARAGGVAEVQGRLPPR